MRTKKFFYNTLSTGIYQLVIMITGFITPRIMLKYYGSELNGLISSISQFIAYFSLVEAGLSSAAVYALYKPLGENDHKAINAIVTAARKFYNQSGYVFLSLTIGLATFYPLIVSLKQLSSFEISALVLVLGVNGTLEFFTLGKYRVLLAADQKTYVISIASLVYVLINTVIIVILGSLKVNIIILRIVALLSIFIRSIILLIYTKSKYKYLDYNVVPNTKALDKRWDALYLQILGTVQKGAPIILLTIITKDLRLVSVYTIFNMIVGAINGLLGIFTSGLSASFGDVIARGEKHILKKAYTEFEFIYYALITIIYSVSFVTIMPFIKIYTNGIEDVNYNLPLVGFLFVLNGFLYNLKTPQGMLIISAGLFKETRIQTTIQGIIVVLVGGILTFEYGIVGVLVGSIISNIYRSIDLLIFIPKKVTNLPIKGTILRLFYMLILITFILFSTQYFHFQIDNYFAWFLYAIIIFCYSSLIILIANYILNRELSKDIVNRIKGILLKS